MAEQVLFNSVDKEVSNSLNASLGGSKTIVRTKGSGNDSYLAIDFLGSSQLTTNGNRNCVRTSKNVLYKVSEGGGTNNLLMQRSSDGGATWEGHALVAGAVAGRVAMAIDSQDVMHICYWRNGTGLNYEKFNPVTFSWFGDQTIYSDAGTPSFPYVAITIDQNDVPHVAMQTGTTMVIRYTNRVGGSWKTPVTVRSGGVATMGMGGLDLTIDKDGKPILASTTQENSNIDARVFNGNNNDATSFGSFGTLVSDQFAPTIVIDKEGNWYWFYVDNGDIKLRKKLYATSAWQSAVNVATGTFEDVTATFDIAGDIYVLTNTDVNVTNYFKSTTGGLTWGSAQTDDMGNITDEKGRFRWSFYNYHFANKLDYVLTNVAGDRTKFNSVKVNPNIVVRNTSRDIDIDGQADRGARQIVRTVNGTLYCATIDTSQFEDVLSVWKSTDEGFTWTEQDTGNTPDTTDFENDSAMAIDSAGIIHVVYWFDAVGLKHTEFNTNTDLFGTTETILAETEEVSWWSGAITVDSNDDLHVASSLAVVASQDNATYLNNVGGSWNTPVTVDSTSADYEMDITIDGDDIPQIATCARFGDGTAFLGNQTNATSFSSFVFETGSEACSIAVSKAGDTYISYLDKTAELQRFRKHFKGDAWSTWQSEVTMPNGILLQGSTIALDRYDNILIGAVDDVGGATQTFFWVSEDGGLTFTEIVDRSDTPQPSNVHLRWSFNNYYFVDQFDYTIADGGTLRIRYNKIFETGADHLYVAGRQPAGGVPDLVQVWCSPTEGNSWELVDSAGSLTGADTDSVSCAIDSSDNIQIIWWDIGVGLRYEIFDMATQLHGTPETANADTGTPATFSTAIAIDENDEPHVVYVESSADHFEYANKVGVSWTFVDVKNTTSGAKVGITIDIDDIPQLLMIRDQSTDDEVSAFLGNLHDATSFSEFLLDSDVAISADNPSIAIDSLGNTFVSWIDINDDVKCRKHNKADAWSTWQTEVNVATGSFEDVSMIIDANDNIIIFSNNQDTTHLTEVWFSTDGGATFSSAVTHDSAGIVDEHIRARWSFLNYNNPSKLDYTIYGETADDVYYNSAFFENLLAQFAGKKALVS